MDRRLFLVNSSVLGLYAITAHTTCASTLAHASDKPGANSLARIDGLEMLASCPADCLDEIHSILGNNGLVSFDLNDLRYMLVDARHLVYLSCSASGSRAIRKAVRLAMLTAPIPMQGIKKLLVMLTANQESLYLRDIDNLLGSIAEYTGKETHLVFGTTSGGSMLAGEMRIGMLVPVQTTFNPQQA